MNNIIMFILTGYVNVLFQMAIVLNIAGIKWTKNQIALSSLVVYIPHIIVFTFFIREYIFAPISMVVWIILMVGTYMLFFKQSWRKSIFMAFGQYIFLSAGINYINFFVVNNLPKDIRYFALENLFILRIIVSVVFVVIFVYTRKFANQELSSLNYLFYKYRTFYWSFFLFFGLFDLLHIADPQYVGGTAEAMVVTLFTVVFVHSLWHLRTRQQLEVTQCELEIEQLYVASQEKTLNSLRGSKQEYKMFINMMREMLKRGEHAKLDSIMEEITEQTPHSVSLPLSTRKIPVLMGTLLEKVTRAELLGIKLELDIVGEFTDLKYCSSLDYCRMMSIFLDNALEAAAHSNDKLIKLSIFVEDGKFKSIITNPFSGELDVSLVYDRNAKIQPSGDGLYQVHLYKDKYKKMGYPMDVSATIENNYFTVALTI